MEKLITQTNRWVLMLVPLVVFYVPYLTVNHIPVERHRLPFILGEENIPFLPWTTVLYLSAFLQGIVVFLKVQKSVFPNIFKLMGLIVLVHITIFLLFPTEYPRECYQSDNIFMVSFRMIDTPANCLPSLHVAVALIFASCYQLSVGRVSRTLVLLFWLWSLMVVVTTLTTKQHYLLDVLVALVLDGVIIYLFRKKLQPRDLNSGAVLVFA